LKDNVRSARAGLASSPQLTGQEAGHRSWQGYGRGIVAWPVAGTPKAL